jgi:uncharacterized paraquat-inducible protein A
MKKKLGLLLNIIAIALFIPGISQPMLSLSMEVIANAGASSLSSQLLNKELSLLATINELYTDDRLLVASLILVFSIVIPLIKTSLITLAFYLKNSLRAQQLVSFVNIIGKWSMADVFVVAVFLTVFSTNHAETMNQHQLSLFGFKLDIMMSSATVSNIGIGFYYFTAYCIVSLIGTQLSYSAFKSDERKAETYHASSEQTS